MINEENSSDDSHGSSEKYKFHLQIIDELPKENIGSLLKLFSSPLFTLDMLMTYLYKKQKIQGVHDYLVNKLYKYPEHELSFYIPQLCYMTIRTGAPSLEKLLLNKCSTSITLFLKIYWCILSYGEAEKKSKKGYEYVKILLHKTQEAMKHGSLNSSKSDERPSFNAEYLTETFRFNDILVSCSLKLKSLKGPERKPALKGYLKRINDNLLGAMRKRHSNDKDDYFRKLFHGIIIPFKSESEDKSNQIVRILEDDVICFNTKKRAPYKIVVETIDMDELSINKPKIDENDDHTPQEDAFEDILSERKKWEKDPNKDNISRFSLQNDKYKQLVDFNKLLEEQNKAEGEKLTDDDLLKKLQGIESQQIVDKTEDHSEPLKQIPLLTKNIDEKFIIDEIHLKNRERFEEKFPENLQRKAGRRYSSRDASTNFDFEIKRKRSRSLPILSDETCISKILEFIECMPIDLRGPVEKALNQLKEEYDTKIKDDYKILRRSTRPTLLRQKTSYEKVGWGCWEELWEYKKRLVQSQSPYGHFKSYKLRSIIVKAADDLRQELIAMQLIQKFNDIWKAAGLKLRVRPYDILVTSNDSGLLEMVVDTNSIDGLKKKIVGKSLLDFFLETYSYKFLEAQKNFIESLAAYCLICYFLQIKDRHNGNILLDAYGNIVHIDFGFIFTISPGSINFESAPFKLTAEYVELMGGYNSDTFKYFKMELWKGLLELRKYVDEFVNIIQVMVEGSDLQCFEDFDVTVFRERFKESATYDETLEYVEKLVTVSHNNWRTIQYDKFQKYTNGVMP